MSTNTKDIQAKVATLKSMFPEWSEDELKEALVQYKGDVEDVVDKILSGLITPWEKLEKNSNNKQSNQNTSNVVGASRSTTASNTSSNSTSINFRNNAYKTNKAPTSKFNSNNVGTKPAQSSRNTGSTASLKKPVTSQIQNSGISKPTSANGTKKSESALEQLQKYKNFKKLTDAEVDDLTWADKMTYKKKLKEFNALQEQAKKEIEKKKIEDESKEQEIKSEVTEPLAVEETQPEKEPVEENAEEEKEQEETEVKEEAEVEQAPVEAEKEKTPEPVVESNNQSNLLGDYSNMKSAVEDINGQPQVGTPSSQFQQGFQPFMGYTGAPNYSQYNQGFMPQNQMYMTGYPDQMAMYNQFVAYNHFQQMQYMQQQQPGSTGSTASNTAPGESPSQQTFDFANGRQMMGMQQPQFMQNAYPSYGGYGQFAAQQPVPGQEDQQPQQGSEMPQQQDQFAYYQQMQQPYGQQNYYNMNQNYNQY